MVASSYVTVTTLDSDDSGASDQEPVVLDAQGWLQNCFSLPRSCLLTVLEIENGHLEQSLGHIGPVSPIAQTVCASGTKECI